MKFFNFFLFIVIVGGVSSCENDEFSPYGDFEDGYSLYSIINMDSDYQIATLKQRYPVNSNPLDNSIIKNANIVLSQDDKFYEFRDTSEIIDDKEISYYYLKGFKPELDKPLYINAVINDITNLSSGFLTPSYLYFNFSTQKSVDKDLFNSYKIEWSQSGDIFYFLPELYLVYYFVENNDTIKFEDSIPLEFIDDGSNQYRKEPKVISNKIVRYNFDAIKKVITDVNSDVTKSQNYIFKNIKVNVKTLSESFANYYNSELIREDGYSVQLDNPNFSNISGGGGLFGCYMNSSVEVNFGQELTTFIKDLNYQINPNIK